MRLDKPEKIHMLAICKNPFLEPAIFLLLPFSMHFPYEPKKVFLLGSAETLSCFFMSNINSALAGLIINIKDLKLSALCTYVFLYAMANSKNN